MAGRVTASHFSDLNLTGVSQLLEDMQRLAEDHESADIMFLLGREEVPVCAHRIILMARCKSFQNAKRGEVCRIPIPGCTVAPPTTIGGPVPIRIPHVQGDIFRKFILYVYTGKIMLQDNAVFEMLRLGQDFGVEEIRTTCEEYVMSTLSPSNASTFLAAAMDIHERTIGKAEGSPRDIATDVGLPCPELPETGGKVSKSFVDRCVAYIGENAGNCVKTNSFLALPKEALIKLISSDSFALEEENVWRAVLNWAKYQAGVTQPTAHWTEEERARVGQHLSGIINHVRILLIDSQVYAEEVESTGAVPMELSLERYRFAAVPNKFRENTEDKRLQPRVSPKLFPGSQILIKRDYATFERLLNSWYGVPKQTWGLVYRATTHGYTAESFHRHCDGISPLFVIALGARGDICGGFTDVPWLKMGRQGHYLESDKAFLFTLANNQGVPPCRFHINKRSYAICYHADCGPIFGAGADLFINGNIDTSKESYSNLPHSYGGVHASSGVLMGSYYFTVLDYEVFTTVNK